MPKLYEYFGLVVFFYANEHEPLHVHGEFQGGHARAEIVLESGKVLRIVFSNVSGKPPLARQDERLPTTGESEGRRHRASLGGLLCAQEAQPA
jgi:hypothetical protein